MEIALDLVMQQWTKRPDPPDGRIRPGAGLLAGPLAVGLLFLASLGVAAASGATASTVRVGLSSSGKALEPGDLRVLVAGEDQPREGAVVSVEPADEDWEIVVLFDLEFSDTATIRASAATIARQVDRLTALGEVSVLTQRGGIQTRAPATREPAVLRDALSWVELQERGDDRQLSYRLSARSSGFVDEQEGAAAAGEPFVVPELGERQSLSAMFDRLSLWLVDRDASARPKALVWVTSGFDLEIRPFYAGEGSEPPAPELSARMPQAAARDLESLLLARGWTLITFGVRDAVPESLADLGRAAPNASDLDAMRPPGERRAEAVLDSKRIGDEIEARRRAEPEIAGRRDALRRIATATDGRDAEELDELEIAIEHLSDAWEVELAQDLAGEAVEVELSNAGRSRHPGRARVSAPRAARGPQPGFVGEIRLRDFLAGEADSGGLSFSAVVENRSLGPELLVQLEVADAAELPASLSVAAAVDGSRPVRVSRAEIVTEVEPGVEVRSLYTVDLPTLALESGEEDRLVIALEDPATGEWGIEYASVLERSEDAPEEELSLFLPGPKAVQLLAPSAPLVAGKTLFETVLSDRSVETVDFLLDGRKFATVRQPPFRATADLGRLPELRTVEVVAYRGGREVGRDALRINEGSGAFRVRIEQPTAEAAESLTGPVNVAVDLELPRGLRVDRLEYFWNDTLVASRVEAPWVERVLVPAAEPNGFVRVVAHLEDGSTSEDVLFFNSPGSTARLDVNLVELYVVVSERDGRPVQGLERADFAISEDGESQRIATFSDAGNLPLTLGLAIDSSASMFVKLPKVQEAAAGFLQGLTPDRDRAFLVGFGDEPTIHRDTTTQVDRVVRALDRLEPDGQTGIWRGIVYSLVQLQGVPGRKALVVYSDGADEDADFSHRTALQFARKVGVPIYVILSNNEIVRTGGKSLKVASFLDRLERMTQEVGGRVFLTRVGDDMASVYAAIENEIRSQYLIGYYSEQTAADRWRKVEVDVPGRRDVRTRTVSGVFR